MRKSILALITLLALSASPTHAAEKGEWIASGGIGLTIPSAFLILPQIDYALQSNLFVGPMAQIALSSGALFAASGAVRYEVGSHPRLRPHVQGGLGLALSSAGVGVNIHLGMGIDYILDRQISLGTVFIANFAPPLSSFYLSWPLIVARLRL